MKTRSSKIVVRDVVSAAIWGMFNGMKRGLRSVIVILVLSLISFIVYRTTYGKKPLNVLIITIDTLRADHLGAYGYSRKISPALDKFAAGATLFENAYCVMPTTVPSHASLFFSTWPRIHGSTSNFMEISNRSLQFLPVSFRNAGYRTAAVVSVHHLGERFCPFGGFEMVDFPDDDRASEVTLKIARSWLRHRQKEKYFFWLHLWDPHSPYKLHPEFMERINPA
ncbi:MAG TPA: sulfatase-like hydrolase/transferase, partial [Acidobacteriota bacterium]